MSLQRKVVITAVLLTLLALPASALELFGIHTGPGFFEPPDATGTAPAGFLAPLVGWSVWVGERGTYTVSSQFVSERFEGRVLVYRGPVDLADPLDRLLAVSDYTDGATELDLLLEAGVIYYVAVTHAVDGQDAILDFEVEVTGPSEPMLSSCLPPGDDPIANDFGESLGLQNDRPFRFCTFVSFRDDLEQLPRTGTTVPYRSDDSGMFWFYDRDNWELLVKVLDGCAVNGHYWVFFAATTNVEFELFVGRENEGLDAGRTYRNELGDRADAVTDTAAFPCEPGG